MKNPLQNILDKLRHEFPDTDDNDEVLKIKNGIDDLLTCNTFYEVFEPATLKAFQALLGQVSFELYEKANNQKGKD